MCAYFGIDQLKTSPYHPQCNGKIERMHSTMTSALSKIVEKDGDWVRKLPYVMMALRMSPNRDTYISPYQAVYGRQVRTPLDVLHQGSRAKAAPYLDTVKWTSDLADRLDDIRDIIVAKDADAKEKRKVAYDKFTKVRQYQVGDKVLYRKPGLTPKLEESWGGPLVVEEVINAVNNRVRDPESKRKGKLCHVNDLKLFPDPPVPICSLQGMSDDMTRDSPSMRLDKELIDIQPTIAATLSSFPDVLTNSPGSTSVLQVEILTEGDSIVSLPPYQIPESKREVVRTELQRLVDQGILERSNSRWSSSLVVVAKPDGGVRLCGNYRRLNAITTPWHAHIPVLSKILEKVGRAKILSKLDLAKGFHQVPMGEATKDKTTLATPFGRFCYLKMPFGIRNAPAIFQNLMDVVLRDCEKFAATYVDDIIIFLNDWSDHLEHIKAVLATLRVWQA